LLARAGGDELHEQPRAELHERAAQFIVSAKTGGAAHAAWSGAGPSVLALCKERAVASVTEAFESTLGGQGCVLRLAMATSGLKVF